MSARLVGLTPPFVELAARSAFTLLDGASTPEALAERAAAVGMPALGLTDHFDLGGIVRFTQACGRFGVRPIVGAEVRCGLPRTDLHKLRWLAHDSPGAVWVRLMLLCADRPGYHALSSLITRARVGSPRGEPVLPLDALRGRTEGLICLVNLEEWGEPAGGAGKGSAEEVLEQLRSLFGDRLQLALENRGLPEDARRCRAWIRYAEERAIAWVPTNAPGMPVRQIESCTTY